MLLLIPGPVQTAAAVRAAMAQDLAPWDNDVRPMLAGLRRRLLELAGGTAGEHVTLPLQGSGHFVLEAAVRSLVPPDGRVLIPLNGPYAERAARLTREVGREVRVLAAPDTAAIAPEAVAAALAADPAIGHVLAVHSETGSGIVNDMSAIGAVVRGAGRRLLVDAVSAFGALPFRLAEQPECDAVMFTSGKCLEGMPGLGFAVARIDRLQPGRAGSWCLDLADVCAHGTRHDGGTFRFTPPIQVLAALEVAVALHAAEGGLPARLARYRENARTLHRGVQALGLSPYLTEAEQGPIVVTVHQPPDPHFALQPFVDALKARGVLISNFSNTEAPTFRIGSIGAVTPQDMRTALDAIGDALRTLGVCRREAA